MYSFVLKKKCYLQVTYINWLHMARAGVLALQYFDPSKGENGWGQAHCQARYVILQVRALIAAVAAAAAVGARNNGPLPTPGCSQGLTWREWLLFDNRCCSRLARSL